MVPPYTGFWQLKEAIYFMKYKAIITDLDGTALDSPRVKLASERLARAVEKLDQVGIQVCAATGRATTFALPVLVSMGLHTPAIVSGGTRIIEAETQDVLWECGLSRVQLEAIVAQLKGLPYGYTWNDSTEEDYLGGGWKLEEFNDFDATYFFEICFVPTDEVPGVLERLQSIKGVTATVVVAQRPNMKDIHITNVAATKEHAIYELEKMIGVKPSEMIGVGDGHNDLHLFNAVGYKVAMGNAVFELKKAADKTIGSVKEEGLAAFFEELAKEMVNEKMV